MALNDVLSRDKMLRYADEDKWDKNTLEYEILGEETDIHWQQYLGDTSLVIVAGYEIDSRFANSNEKSADFEPVPDDDREEIREMIIDSSESDIQKEDIDYWVPDY